VRRSTRRHRRRRRKAVFAASRPGSVRWLEPARSRRRRRVPVVPILALVLLLAAAGGAFAVVQAQRAAEDDRRAAAQTFATAWARGDLKAAWRATTAGTRAEWPLADFRSSDRAARREVTAQAVRAGRARTPQDGRVEVPVAVRTRLFGALRGTLVLPVQEEDGEVRVAWAPHLRLPGLRPGERVRRRVLRRPRRRPILAADGRRLAAEPTAAAIVGSPPSGDDPGSGLEARFDDRLGGRPGAELRFGARVIARVPVRPGHPLRSTIRPVVQRAATAALGGQLGGIAVVHPRSGAVLALAGLAVSAPQPPGSTFKIVTLAGALQAGVATPASAYPVQTAATLSGVPVRNAGDEACGGSLAFSFAHSCNSVFAPLGAKLGARRLVRFAEAFGFNEQLDVPAAKVSSFPPPRELRDDLAVGASAIGQDRDLATPLTMASVAATIANRGVRVRPRIARHQVLIRRRAVRRRVARLVRDMMVGVVRGGTGVAAALPGVEVAGKTGTAELRPTADGPQDPSNTDAWFAAFAPADAPRLAVAVMLIGAGQGGASAAPLARSVLAAGL
jgi:peptidoglycan glycosyltransferase